MTTALPAIFLGHGNPMNALQANTYTESWRPMGAALPRPSAIVAISAHWYSPGTAAHTPTPDHYLPLLYVLGTWRQGDPITFPIEGVDGGSISMLAVSVGSVK